MKVTHMESKQSKLRKEDKMNNVTLTTLEDEKKYVVLDEIQGTNKYVYLLDPEDEENMTIRKEILKDNEKYLQGLNDDNEFTEAITLYQQKNA